MTKAGEVGVKYDGHDHVEDDCNDTDSPSEGLHCILEHTFLNKGIKFAGSAFQSQKKMQEKYLNLDKKKQKKMP